MKERSTLSGGKSAHSSTSSIPAGNDNNVTTIPDPYNSNNFMAPPIGSTVKCVTCLGNNVLGKVIAYDQQTKMLALSMDYLHLYLKYI
jgi:hypothetical protein